MNFSEKRSDKSVRILSHRLPTLVIGWALILLVFAGVWKANELEAGQFAAQRTAAEEGDPLKLDIAFVIDATGSMWDDVAAVEAAVDTIVDVLVDGGHDYRIGVTSFKDFPEEDSAYVSRVDTDFITDTEVIRTAVDSIDVTGGGDWPETVLSGVMEAVNLSWRSSCDVRRVIVLLGDAPPHDPEQITGYSTESTIEATQIPECDSAIYPILIGSDSEARAAFLRLATGTGGRVFPARNASEVVDAVLGVLNEVVQPQAVFADKQIAQPGSTFIISGTSFPTNTVVTVTVGWPDGEMVVLTDTLSTDETGQISFALKTSPSLPEGYITAIITAASGETARVSLEISDSAACFEEAVDETIPTLVVQPLAPSGFSYRYYFPFISFDTDSTPTPPCGG